MLVGLMTVASAGCTFCDSCPRRASRVTGSLAWGCLNTLKLLRLTQYVAVISPSSCPAVLEADISRADQWYLLQRLDGSYVAEAPVPGQVSLGLGLCRLGQARAPAPPARAPAWAHTLPAVAGTAASRYD
jgi:hypothetical protein